MEVMDNICRKLAWFEGNTLKSSLPVPVINQKSFTVVLYSFAGLY